jgi:hypothetical protein
MMEESRRKLEADPALSMSSPVTDRVGPPAKAIIGIGSLSINRRMYQRNSQDSFMLAKLSMCSSHLCNPTQITAMSEEI